MTTKSGRPGGCPASRRCVATSWTTSCAVSIAQFHGIEINDFAVSVAKTALWIAEAQMLRETAEILHREPDYLPLKDYDNIVEGNALRIDWQSILNAECTMQNAQCGANQNSAFSILHSAFSILHFRSSSATRRSWARR